MTLTENVGRCPRCQRYMIEEESRTHTCDFTEIELKGAKEIVLDHVTDLGQNKVGDHVRLGWGLDAVLYRLVECKHNPPHATKRKFTGCGTKQEGNSTSFGALLHLWDTRKIRFWCCFSGHD